MQKDAAVHRTVSGRGHRAQDEELERYRRLAGYCADLHRLAAALARLDPATGHHRALRIQALRNAYDQVVLQAAAELGIDAPFPVPLSSADRLGLEAQLSVAGLRW